MNSKEAIEIILKDRSKDLSIVSSLGRTAQEIFNHLPNQTLFLDSMGDVISTGIGVALGLKENQPVMAFDTDGSFFMGITILSSLAALSKELPNLTILIINNEILESAGGMKTCQVMPRWLELGLAWGIEITEINSVQDLQFWMKTEFEQLQILVLNVDNTEIPSQNSTKTIDGIESKYLFVRHIERLIGSGFIYPCIKN